MNPSKWLLNVIYYPFCLLFVLFVYFIYYTIHIYLWHFLCFWFFFSILTTYILTSPASSPLTRCSSKLSLNEIRLFSRSRHRDSHPHTNRILCLYSVTPVPPHSFFHCLLLQLSILPHLHLPPSIRLVFSGTSSNVPETKTGTPSTLQDLVRLVSVLY